MLELKTTRDLLASCLRQVQDLDWESRQGRTMNPDDHQQHCTRGSHRRTTGASAPVHQDPVDRQQAKASKEGPEGGQDTTQTQASSLNHPLRPLSTIDSGMYSTTSSSSSSEDSDTQVQHPRLVVSTAAHSPRSLLQEQQDLGLQRGRRQPASILMTVGKSSNSKSARPRVVTIHEEERPPRGGPAPSSLAKKAAGDDHQVDEGPPQRPPRLPKGHQPPVGGHLPEDQGTSSFGGPHPPDCEAQSALGHSKSCTGLGDDDPRPVVAQQCPVAPSQAGAPDPHCSSRNQPSGSSAPVCDEPSAIVRLRKEVEALKSIFMAAQERWTQERDSLLEEILRDSQRDKAVPADGQLWEQERTRLSLLEEKIKEVLVMLRALNNMKVSAATLGRLVLDSVERSIDPASNQVQVFKFLNNLYNSARDYERLSSESQIRSALREVEEHAEALEGPLAPPQSPPPPKDPKSTMVNKAPLSTDL